MRRAHENPNTKWIILGVHRAFYSSDKTEYAEITHLTAALEELVNKYKVDIVQTGHLHSYERSWPTYKGKAQK
jgi:predicted phosphodiesterase